MTDNEPDLFEKLVAQLDWAQRLIHVGDVESAIDAMARARELADKLAQQSSDAPKRMDF